MTTASAPAAPAKAAHDSFLRATRDGALLVGEGGRILACNDGAQRVYGYDEAELLALNVSALLPCTEKSEDHGAKPQVSEARFGLPLGESIESLHRRKDGSTFPVVVSATSTAAFGKPVALAVVRDLSHRQDMEARLAQADRLATVGTLAAGIVHEINNPLTYTLTSMRSLGQLVPRVRHAIAHLSATGHLGDPSDHGGLAKQLDDLATLAALATEGVESMAAIVRDLASMARLEPVPLAPVDVHSVLDTCVNVVQHQIRGRARIVRRYGDLPLALTSSGRIMQVFLNLLINAAEALTCPVRDHEIVLTTSCQGGRIVVEIADTGSGIAEGCLEKLFTPFFTTKTQGGGTGLGLYISRAILTDCGGDIDVASRVDEGTRVTVRLPISNVTADRAPFVSENSLPRASESG